MSQIIINYLLNDQIIILFLCLGLLYWWFNYHKNNIVISENIKLVIFVPVDYLDIVREAIGKAGAGHIDNYDYCSFITNGTGYYRSLDNAKPTIGEIGKLSFTLEVRIETICPRNKIQDIIEAAKKVHPYEVMGYDLYPLIEL
ncbi:hypothetical protein H012_gp062 [Acanthamoeba polyphaga moumouvirus]|uniref:Uncharacterized protein n=1 Tax=Acanthamoeba polyphaga moumouvirus TaxID=1269028 RepID=L7RDM1_9VIRU|nr:hypothetical protein H012_gp062 [Acanthamoeba polyphaga moumouvirus]AGC02386.1 hypothetical protein Moumou_00871 [Acanthamoeba polyphaga moumouvirus]